MTNMKFRKFEDLPSGFLPTIFETPKYNVPIVEDFDDPQIVYSTSVSGGTCSAGYDQIIWSQDGGNSFSQYNNYCAFGNVYDITQSHGSPNNILYVCSKGIGGGGVSISCLYFKDHDNIWSPISTLPTGINPDYIITTVETDPNDAERVWIGLGRYGSNTIGRIHYSENSGDTWASVSNGLNGDLPINCLLYVSEISTLFCGTDIGVYYLEDNTTEWQPFGGNLPFVIISDLKYNSTSHELIAATYGRGLWRIQIHCDDFTFFPINPAGNWNGLEQTVNDIIEIPPGAVLTIDNCNLSFTPCSKIIVMPGGKLIINNSTLKSLADRFWGGIIVRGDRNNPQTIDPQTSLPFFQGILELENTTIENAYSAVEIADNYQNHGGIIKAESSTFKNCRKMVGFGSYSYPNSSYFYNCSFTCTGPLVDDNFDNKGTNQFVSMWDVHGIEFRGCTFKNEGDYGIYSDDNRGTGIFTIDASFNVYPMDDPNTAIEPCDLPDGERNKFINLAVGISTSSSVGIQNDVKILDNDFINCRNGIESRNDIGNIIFGNIFEWKNGFYLSNEGEELALLGSPIGIYTESSIDFLAMSNQFIWENGLTGIPPTAIETQNPYHGVFAGIYTSNSDVQQTTNYSKILKNTFDRQTTNAEKYVVGNYINGTNTKLLIPCNTYTNLNEDDWYIQENSTLNDQAKNVFTYYNPLNSFSITHNCNTSYKIYNHSFNSPIYYYNSLFTGDLCFNNVAFNQWPDYPCDNDITQCDVYSFWNGWDGEPPSGDEDNLPGLKEGNDKDPNQDNIFKLIYSNSFEEADQLILKWHPENDEEGHLKSLVLLTKSIYSDNRNWNNLLDIEIENLHNLTQFEDQAGLMSRQLLTYFTDYDFPPKILIINKSSEQPNVPVNIINLKIKDEISFDIYPNPTNNQFTIEYRLPAEMHSAVITIFDLSGKKVREFNLTENQGSLSVSKLEVGEAGMYQCIISLDENQKQVKKVLIIE
ncbi:MAG: T9SS type A sorting domain-containing protein [Bacteroidetes bacterium]|nr:T9SS type A sorting domain-containing protein [Bacteroidota bacterium]MBT6838069.1 T9SS type A sorting domain-containing protein [Bacteroidota bacterium]